MRHGDKINNLSRTQSHRRALLANLACQLIEHKRINTTLAKAKALRVYVEPLITKSKNDNTHNRRLVFSKLHDKSAVTELFGTVSNKVAERPGGYTRIIKLPARFGDASDMAMIELVDFNTIYVKGGKAEETKKTRRSRRSSGKSKQENAPATPVAEAGTEKEKVEKDEAAASTPEVKEPQPEEPKVKEPQPEEPKVKEPETKDQPEAGDDTTDQKAE